MFLHVGQGLQHGGGDAGEALVRVAEDETGDGHSVDGGGIVGTGRKAESDGADQKEVAGEEFEISFDGRGDVGMVVLAEGGFPQERGAKKAGEDVDQHKGGAEESSRRVGGEFLHEIAEVLAVSLDLEEGEDSQGNVEDLNFDSGRGLDEAIAFSDG